MIIIIIIIITMKGVAAPKRLCIVGGVRATPMARVGSMVTRVSEFCLLTADWVTAPSSS